jgi:hydrogenase maturation protein HypF
VTRCDDSVVRLAGDGAPQFLRRARGYTPRAVRLADDGPSVLALGGWFKNTVCATRGDEAFVSEHVGDLDNAATCAALERAVEHLTAILEIEPVAVAHDLHPDFFSTRLAHDLALRWGVPALAVQHHHAHVAAVAAEHRCTGALLGLALDGVGLGTDGTAWGGELLRVDGARFERVGHFAPLRLPGGDRAAREPWRMAAAALYRGGRGDDIAARFADEPGAATIARMLARGVRSPATTSAGRWFDAAAGLLGVSRRMAFEGQAAMLLEGLAEAHGPVAADRSLWSVADGVLDLTALAMRLADEHDARFGASLFHATLVAALSEWVERAAQATGLRTVACGGGCFLNAILARGLRAALTARGIAMVEANAVPPNDGGLALGQAAVARDLLDRT